MGRLSDQTLWDSFSSFFSHVKHQGCVVGGNARVLWLYIKDDSVSTTVGYVLRMRVHQRLCSLQ